MPRTISDLPGDVAAAYPYRSRFAQVNGLRMHYVDEGPAGAPPVLLQHGNPAWGYLWRATAARLLAAGYRVIIPDQIGFGLSEKPHDHRVHTLDNHAANLVALLDALDLRGVSFVLHDWGGPTGLAALLTRPRRAAAVAVMSTWAWPDQPSRFHAGIVPWRFMHAPLTGPYLLGRRAAMPGRGMYLSVVDRSGFDPRPYEAVLSDSDERALTWIWPRSIPLAEPSDITVPRFEWLERSVAGLRLPATIIWGREDDVFAPEVFAARWHRIWPHAEGTHLVTGRHFVQEDSGDRIGELLVDFLDRRVRPQWNPAARASDPTESPSGTGPPGRNEPPGRSEPPGGVESATPRGESPDAPGEKSRLAGVDSPTRRGESPDSPGVDRDGSPGVERDGRRGVEVGGEPPAGVRAVPVLAEHQLGHYPEFRDALTAAFASGGGTLRVGERHYRVELTGTWGAAQPHGVRIDALVPGLEPVDGEDIDVDLWAILRWLVAAAGDRDARWSVDGLETTGRIYRVPAALAAARDVAGNTT